MKKSPKGGKGFTLIELMVVIAIIGILASVVVASVNSARKRGRDATRMRNIQEIRTAIELYIDQNGVAPDMGIPTCSDPGSYDNQCFANETNQTGNWDVLESQLSPYISKLEKDPCGISCYNPDSPDLRNRGVFTYTYQPPGTLGYLNDSVPGTVDVTTYRIFAENLESRSNTYFGFGPGSF
jgi:prepilin-type N-terminal cleavage/methylation domain-containing protein